MPLILGIFAAIVFALGALAFKRAYAEGAGVVHALVINNVLIGILFLPLLGFGSGPIPWNHWYMPVLTGLAFMVGHVLNVLSIRLGDVSVVTPLLGSKVVFVAFLCWLVFRIELSAIHWISSFMATAGVLIMGRSERHSSGGKLTGILLALGCAAAFALTDVLIQSWGSSFGVAYFLPLQFAALGCWSLVTLPFFGLRSLKAPKAAWPWVGLAAALSALQAVLITIAIAVWKDASAVNVAYATRGLWTIGFVWSLGKLFANTELHQVSRKTILARIGGAVMILLAVVLTTLFRKS